MIITGLCHFIFQINFQTIVERSQKTWKTPITHIQCKLFSPNQSPNLVDSSSSLDHAKKIQNKIDESVE